jgi:purine-binding chemotaxis protein CheW
VEQTPNFGVSLDTQYILGMAKTGDQVRILLDIDRVLGEEEMALMGRATGGQAAGDAQGLMSAF